MSADLTRGTLHYDDLVLATRRSPISGTIRPGEILGLAGLEGQGQEHFLHALVGLDKPVAGRVTFRGAQGTSEIANHRQAAKHGVVYLPRDRRATGIFPGLSVLDNFGLPSMPAFSKLGILARRRQKERLAYYTEFLSIKYPDMAAPISALSGGNQQKVLLARWLALEPRVMLLNDPTRGVDLNTRLKFYEAFKKLTQESQIALVILSSEIEEILHICDRVAVFRDFEIHSTIEKQDMTMSRVLGAMFGQQQAAI